MTSDEEILDKIVTANGTLRKRILQAMKLAREDVFKWECKCVAPDCNKPAVVMVQYKDRGILAWFCNDHSYSQDKEKIARLENTLKVGGFVTNIVAKSIFPTSEDFEKELRQLSRHQGVSLIELRKVLKALRAEGERTDQKVK